MKNSNNIFRRIQNLYFEKAGKNLRKKTPEVIRREKKKYSIFKQTYICDPMTELRVVKRRLLMKKTENTSLSDITVTY